MIYMDALSLFIFQAFFPAFVYNAGVLFLVGFALVVIRAISLMNKGD